MSITFRGADILEAPDTCAFCVTAVCTYAHIVFDDVEFIVLLPVIAQVLPQSDTV